MSRARQSSHQMKDNSIATDRRSVWWRFQCVLLIGLIVAVRCPAQANAAIDDRTVRSSEAKTLSENQILMAQQLSQKVSASEWLGPLAPVALSPFFGIACLSGLATYGDRFVSADNVLLQAASPLNNPAIFWTFAALTLVTSLPRFSKVSKPFAQAVDQVEAWAGVLSVFAVKFFLNAGDAGAGDEVVLQAGVISFTAETLLMLAAALNILVINAVKFFFEMLVWVTPVPFLDAMFEAANKAVCAGLMAIYSFSPTLATVINLILFAICLLAFRWIRRRTIFYRNMMFGFIKSWWSVSKSFAQPLIVFPKNDYGPFQDRAKCELARTDAGWKLTQKRWFRSPLEMEIASSEHAPKLDAGWLMNRVIIGEDVLHFSRRAAKQLDEIAQTLNLSYERGEVTRPASEALKAEFA